MKTVDVHELAGLPTSWAAMTNVTGTQNEPDLAQLDVKDGRISKCSSSIRLLRFLGMQYTKEKFEVTDEQDGAR